MENQPSPVRSSLYVFTFLSLHAFSTIIFRQRYLLIYYIVGWKTSLLRFVHFFLSLNALSTVIFVKDISKTIQDRNLIFSIQTDNGKLYRGIENEPSSTCSSLYFFFLSIFFVKDISTTVQHRKFIFCIQIDNDKLYSGIENQPSPVCSCPYMFTFLSLHGFSTIIFHQRYL